MINIFKQWFVNRNWKPIYLQERSLYQWSSWNISKFLLSTWF